VTAAEEHTMITAETPPAGGTPRGIRGRPSHQRAKVAIQTFFLAAAFFFTGAPSAAADAMFANGMTSSWEPPPCRGDKPGVCPYYYDQPGNTTLDRSSIGGSGEENTSPGSLTP